MVKSNLDYYDNTEWMHFTTWCTLNIVSIWECAEAGLSKEDTYSAVYPVYLRNKKREMKYILSIEKSMRMYLKKIIKNNREKTKHDARRRNKA